MTVPIHSKLHIKYPSSDGKPMADNTRQWNWITFIKNGLEETTAGENIFVAGDLLWYPVEGKNKIRVAPDVMVAIGRPKGDRNSYLQWREDHLAPQIVFEVLSPGNTKKEMAKKLLWYEKYQVIEYYVYDPDFNKLEIYNREGDKLVRIKTNNWTSPLLKFRLSWTSATLELFHPNGNPFLSHAEMVVDAKSTKIEIQKGKVKIQEEQAKVREEKMKVQEEKAKVREAEAKIQEEKAKVQEAEAKTALLAAKLKELGIDPESLL